MNSQKPVRKPELMSGCESCIHRGGDFSTDLVDPSIIRVYCKARHFDADAVLMSKNCDFYKLNPTYEFPKKDSNRYGL